MSLFLVLLAAGDGKRLKTRIPKPFCKVNNKTLLEYSLDTFKNFSESQKFVNEVGNIAESQGHHPDIAFGWGYAKVHIFTHKIKGLVESDFILAAKINKI